MEAGVQSSEIRSSPPWWASLFRGGAWVPSWVRGAVEAGVGVRGRTVAPVGGCGVGGQEGRGVRSELAMAMAYLAVVLR